MTVVRARRAIADSPLARTNDSVPKGSAGEVVDELTADELVAVDFNGRILLCDIQDIAVVRGLDPWRYLKTGS